MTAAYPWRGCRGKAGRLTRRTVSSERGNHLRVALTFDQSIEDGQVRRRPMTLRWGGVLVVVGGRESRPQGEGGQRIRSSGSGRSGDRW